MTLRDYIISIIRTAIPGIVGTIVAFLAGYGIEVDESALTKVVGGLIVGGFIAGYHALGRLLEDKVHPWLGVLLGWTSRPLYEKPKGQISSGSDSGA